MVFMQAEAGAQTINEAAQQPVVVSTNQAAATATTEVPAASGTEGAEAPQKPSGIAAFLGNPLFMFIIIIAIMYFLMIRPQRKRQKEVDNFRRSLKPGMDVVTSGGIYGKIKEINDGIVVIEIAHNVNVRVDISVVFADPASAQNSVK